MNTSHEPLLRLGSHDPAVERIRAILGRINLLPASAAQDADPTEFTPAIDSAIRHFQQSRGLKADGIVGPLTWRRINEARWQLGDRALSFSPGALAAGDDVAALQRKLNDLGFDCGRVDGIFGSRTDAALRDFQTNLALEPTGICDEATIEAFANLARAITGGRPESLRDAHEWDHRPIGIVGKVVVIDPGHGDDDRGCEANGIVEADVVVDIAERIERLLAAQGVAVLLTRGRSFHHDRTLDDAARAEFANSVCADMVISLHIDHSSTTHARGASAFYFGSPDTGAISQPGHKLAEQLVHQLCRGTGLDDLGTHARTWDLLRLTRMPAARIYLGYASNPADAALLHSGEFRDAVAHELATAIVGFFSPAHSHA